MRSKSLLFLVGPMLLTQNRDATANVFLRSESTRIAGSKSYKMSKHSKSKKSKYSNKSKGSHSKYSSSYDSQEDFVTEDDMVENTPSPTEPPSSMPDDDKEEVTYPPFPTAPPTCVECDDGPLASMSAPSQPPATASPVSAGEQILPKPSTGKNTPEGAVSDGSGYLDQPDSDELPPNVPKETSDITSGFVLPLMISRFGLGGICFLMWILMS